jgi:hypothetical protein
MFSLVVSHVEKHKQDEQKPNTGSLLDSIYEDWRRENKNDSTRRNFSPIHSAKIYGLFSV